MSTHKDELAAAYTLMNQGDMDEALEHALKAITLDGGNAEGYAIASQIYGLMDDHEKALKHSRKAYELKPEDTNLALSHALFLMESGEFNEALEITDKVVKKGASPEVLQVRSSIFLNMGDEKNAITEAHNAYKTGQGIEYKLNYAMVLSEFGKIEDSTKILKEALKEDNGSFEAKYLLYRNYLAMGDVKNSIKYIKDCLESSPEDPDVMSELATLMEELDDPELAEKYHKKAAGIAGEDEDILLDMADFYLTQDKPDQALIIAESLLKEEGSVDAMLLKGRALMALGKLADAVTFLQEAVEVTDDDEAKMNLGLCLYQDGKMDQAEKIFLDLSGREFQKEMSDSYLDRIWWKKNRKSFKL